MSGQSTDFLDGMDMGGVEPETPETPEPETPQPAPETVDAPPPAATTAPETPEEKTVPYAAMKAEREKRQRLERELEQYRQSQQPRVPEPEPTLQVHLQTVEERANARLVTALEEQAREVYPDFDEVFAEVEAAAEKDPAVARKILTAANPALAAYKEGKRLREQKQMEDPVAYRERLRAELRAELEAEQKAKDEARAKAAAAVPPDLTDSRNAKGQFTPAADSVFSDLFPRN